MKKTFNRGFTLIELLVVIAIIGILASVILASLNSARAKGTDAAVKSELANARAQAELFYSSTATPTYAGVCSSTTNTNSIHAILVDVAAKNSTTLNTTATQVGSATLTSCHDSATAWAAESPLKSVTSPQAYWCVDSTGNSKQTTSVLTSGTTGFACQ